MDEKKAREQDSRGVQTIARIKYLFSLKGIKTEDELENDNEKA